MQRCVEQRRLGLLDSWLASFIRATSQLRAEVFGPRLFLFARGKFRVRRVSCGAFPRGKVGPSAAPQHDNFVGIYPRRRTKEELPSGGITIRDVVLVGFQKGVQPTCQLDFLAVLRIWLVRVVSERSETVRENPHGRLPGNVDSICR